MTKVTLASVGNVIDATTAAATINSNNAAIVAAIENTLSRDGTQPDQMNASLDMNSHDIINLPTPVSQSSPLRVQDVNLLNGGGTLNILPVGGTSSQVLTKNSATNYDASWQSQLTTTATQLFGGRLTLVSSTPIMSDVTGSQNLYYTPYNGKTIPTYTAGVWTTRAFTSSSTDQVGLTLNLAGSANWSAGSLHDVFAVMDSGVLKLATRLWDAGMSSTETLITPNTAITTGTTPNAWTNSSNAFDGTTSRVFATSAQVPTSNSGTTNFIGQDWGVGNSNVISKIIIYAPTDAKLFGPGLTAENITIWGSSDNVNWFFISTTRVNDSVNGTVFTIPINTYVQQAFRYHRVGIDGNGANTIAVAQLQFYKSVPAAAGRRLTHLDGVLVNDAVMTARTSASTTISVAQYEGIYLGTIHIDTSTAGQCSAKLAYGSSRTYGVWNYYNRIPLKMLVGTYATSNVYNVDTSTRWVNLESTLSAGTSWSGEVLCGVAEEWVESELSRSVFLNCAAAPVGYEVGIAVDTSVTFSGTESSANIDIAGQQIGFLPRAWLRIPPFAGIHTLYGLERTNGGAGLAQCFTGPRNTSMTIEWRG